MDSESPKPPPDPAQSRPAAGPAPVPEGEAQPGSEELLEPAPARGWRHELQDQYSFLETLLAGIVSALILLTLAINLFFFKQMRLARAQLSGQREVINKGVSDFHKFREPAIRNFVTSLESFASTNADFRPVLERYRPWLGKYLTSGGPAPTPALSPVPAPRTAE